jgi:hypothetical protein
LRAIAYHYEHQIDGRVIPSGLTQSCCSRDAFSGRSRE